MNVIKIHSLSEIAGRTCWMRDSAHGTLDQHAVDFEKRHHVAETVLEFEQPGHGGRPAMTMWFFVVEDQRPDDTGMEMLQE